MDKVVSVFSFAGPWTWQKLMSSALWISAVTWAIYKVIFEKTWGSARLRNRLVLKRQQIRLQRFDKIRADFESNDQKVLARRGKILALSLSRLRDELQKETFSASDALDAYIWKAFEAQRKVNCLIDFLFEAVEEARSLDDKYRGREKPPLFGIPFSVKGNFYMQGYDSSIGLAKFLFQPMEKDCSLVTFLRTLGAVPFVHTNVPQALISFVCSNSIYGTTGNPHNVGRTPGGSTGGEAALLVSGGTPFGIGSDIAGSMRIPPAFCGCVSLKPTEGRLVVVNTNKGVPGKSRLGFSFGFFTKNVDDQILLLSQVLCSEFFALTPRTVPLPFKSADLEEQSSPLRIGYFTHDGFLPPVPGCARAVTETVELLRGAGHQLLHFVVPDPQLMASLVFKNIMNDGGDYMRSLYSDDVVDPYMKQFVMMLKIPNWTKRLLGTAVSRICPQGAIMARSIVKTSADLRNVHEQSDDYGEKFIDEWNELELDALICPAFCVPSVPHAYPSQLGACAVATGLFNLLDFPAGIVPTGVVTEEDDRQLASEKHWPTGRNPILKIMRKAAANSVGMPLAVQIVTLPYREEQCLRVMKTVEALWHNHPEKSSSS